MDFIVVAIAALVAAGLTLFSGFGLGTLLMPVAAFFFPLETAIAMTAVVHLANNLFKLFLVGKKAVVSVLIRFGLPAILAALLGAFLLGWLSQNPWLVEYVLLGRHFKISGVKFVVGILIVVFVFVEILPVFSRLEFSAKYLSVGGLLSGFFGGLSGHQGAFRSMFLIKAGLSKEQFVATGAVLAVMVDFTRMLVYGKNMAQDPQPINWALTLTAVVAAWVGSFIGARVLGKVTLGFVQKIVAVLLITIAVGLILGVI
jgi:uncharacterized protein